MLQFLETSLRQLNSELKAARKIHHLDVDLDVFRNQKWKNLNDLEEEGIDVFGKRSKTTPTAKLKCFVSYAHADDSRYMRCFVDGIRKHSEWDIFDDRGIPLGADWHQTLLREVRQCDFGIYLLSQAFIKSDYIREHEFGAFVERQQQQGFPFFGVLLSECQFEPIQDIASRQFFNALGQDYGLADTHRDKQITFDRLARIYHGAIEPNPDREAFFKSFVAKANAVLKEIFP